jgi:hypothetical protein
MEKKYTYTMNRIEKLNKLIERKDFVADPELKSHFTTDTTRVQKLDIPPVKTFENYFGSMDGLGVSNAFVPSEAPTTRYDEDDWDDDCEEE